MKLTAISEHFLPRVGGTTHYVCETCRALSESGVDVHLLVPGPQPKGVDVSDLPYAVSWIDAGYPETGDPSRQSRYEFCERVNERVLSRTKAGEVDVVHVLFGLFVMEVLDTNAVRAAGANTVATVHNLPPLECGRTWSGDPLSAQARDALRLRAVAWKNNARLRRHRYDTYITPSEQVAAALKHVLSEANINPVAHGISEDLVSRMAPPLSRRPAGGEPVRLLTLGGWMPHKRQHIIPDIASRLVDAGIDFQWRVAGPAGRLAGYKDSVDAILEAQGLTGKVSTSGAVPFPDLPALYDAAHLYVQPSTEEGFCITALDAAAGGLPVIASPAGALPDICTASGGTLVPSDPDAIAGAIIAHVERDDDNDDPRSVADRTKSRFSWEKSALAVLATYGKRKITPGQSSALLLAERS
ncbi:MAG: glycosyltransferase family 4 protein [Pseudomonadota bacterium]